MNTATFWVSILIPWSEFLPSGKCFTLNLFSVTLCKIPGQHSCHQIFLYHNSIIPICYLIIKKYAESHLNCNWDNFCVCFAYSGFELQTALVNTSLERYISIVNHSFWKEVSHLLRISGSRQKFRVTKR